MLRKALLFVAAGLGLTAAHAPAAAQTSARIGYIPVIGASQIFVADKEGLLKKAGLDAKFITFESGPAMIQALASGSIDIYVAGVAPLAVARSKGIDVRVVAATAIDEMTTVAGAKLAPYFKDGVPPAQALKDFKAATGKAARFATQPPGSVPHTTLVHWLAEVAKADKADYEVVTMGIDATQQAVLAAAVDGATLREPAVTVSILRDPKLKIVANGSQMFPNQPGTVVGIAGAFADKNKDATQGLVSAVVEATNIIKKDADRAAGPIEAALGKGIVDRATIVKALKSPASNFESDPRSIIDSYKKMQAYQVKIGSLDKELPLDGLFDASYYAKATGK
jgi:NitT/TauT family transport system substrate-binding protein